jgi:hypothetical protein
MNSKTTISLVLAAIAAGSANAEPQNDQIVYAAQYQEEAYIASIENDHSEATPSQGVVRHGRWIYSIAPGVCEEMNIHLHGFTSIPTRDGVIQQPEVTSTKKLIDCPKG